jgi:hypothetical protein
MQALRAQLQQLEAQQQQHSDTAAQPTTPDAQPGVAKALAEAEVTIIKRKVQHRRTQGAKQPSMRQNFSTNPHSLVPTELGADC